MRFDKIEKGVSLILEGMGIDKRDKNFIDTPERYARFIAEMFGEKNIDWATFPEDYTDFILLNGHTMHSLCPHHLLPVEFKVSVAYIPNGKVLGLSKLARVLDEANSGPLLQEKFTQDVVHLIEENCSGVKGAACYINGQHGCTKIRGVKSTARFVTYHLHGEFKDSPTMEKRFFDLVKMGV
jgi:GTP cyclohydrolase I